MAICLALAAFAQAHDMDNDRYYFDARQGHAPGLYIQLIRPWMQAQRGADWRTTRYMQTLDYDAGSNEAADINLDRRIENFTLWDNNGGQYGLFFWLTAAAAYTAGGM